MKDQKPTMEELQQWQADRKAKLKAQADYVTAETAKDPRVTHIYRHFRYIFLRDTEGNKLEREKLLHWAECVAVGAKRRAETRASQPKRFWQFWKH